MIWGLWRRLFARRVFLSYALASPNNADAALAEIVAAELQQRGFRTYLEADKREGRAGEPSRHYYELIAGSEAVVLIVSPTSAGRPWPFFEALTAKQQNKLHIIVADDAPVHRDLAEGQLILHDAALFRAPLTRQEAADKLAEAIERASPKAQVYRSVPGYVLTGQRFVVALLALAAAVMTFISLFDNARKAVCAHSSMSARCVEAGWPDSAAQEHID